MVRKFNVLAAVATLAVTAVAVSTTADARERHHVYRHAPAYGIAPGYYGYAPGYRFSVPSYPSSPGYVYGSERSGDFQLQGRNGE